MFQKALAWTAATYSQRKTHQVSSVRLRWGRGMALGNHLVRRHPFLLSTRLQPSHFAAVVLDGAVPRKPEWQAVLEDFVREADTDGTILPPRHSGKCLKLRLPEHSGKRSRTLHSEGNKRHPGRDKPRSMSTKDDRDSSDTCSPSSSSRAVDKHHHNPGLSRGRARGPQAQYKPLEQEDTLDWHGSTAAESSAGSGKVRRQGLN